MFNTNFEEEHHERCGMLNKKLKEEHEGAFQYYTEENEHNTYWPRWCKCFGPKFLVGTGYYKDHPPHAVKVFSSTFKKDTRPGS